MAISVRNGIVRGWLAWQCQRRLCVQSLLHRADPLLLQIVSENINKYPERRDNARRRQRAVEPTDEYAAWTRGTLFRVASIVRRQPIVQPIHTEENP